MGGHLKVVVVFPVAATRGSISQTIPYTNTSLSGECCSESEAGRSSLDFAQLSTIRKWSAVQTSVAGLYKTAASAQQIEVERVLWLPKWKKNPPMLTLFLILYRLLSHSESTVAVIGRDPASLPRNFLLHEFSVFVVFSGCFSLWVFLLLNLYEQDVNVWIPNLS